MAHLEQRKLRGVAMRELRRSMGMGNEKDLVGLTFDDGYKDFLYTAVPILEKFGFTATVAVVVDMLGKENDWQHMYVPRPRIKLLELEEIHEVAKRGMEVGSHSMTHTNLLGVEPVLLSQEVDGSRRMLSELLGEEVEGFYYPYGALEDATARAARRAGYAYACGWKTHVEHNFYDLPRIPVSRREWPLRFAAKLRTYPQYAAIRYAPIMRHLGGCGCA
jgi:peptidoglycan/xylan/chitin deacetylase (PgdA/CDA1 family)